MTDLEERTYRNHPSVVLKNILVVVFVFGFMVFGFTEDTGYLETALAVYAALVAGMSALFVRWWMKTTYTIGEQGIEVDVDTLFKRHKFVQYSKIASINVYRGILNRVFGTTVLLFNINSSVNSNRAEASICLKSDIADALRNELNSRLFEKEVTVEEDRHIESMIRVSNLDIIVHGLIGQPTGAFVWGMLFLAYSVYMLRENIASGAVTSMVMFALTTGIPWIRTIMQYYNYRVYRVGDTITVESGMLSTFRFTFDVGKLNSVYFSEPLFARMVGKTALVAEVVGVAGSDGKPLLCPLKKRSEVMDLFSRLVPEMDIGGGSEHEPVEAFWPQVMKAFVYSGISIGIGALAEAVIRANLVLDAMDEQWMLLLGTVFYVVIPVLLIFHAVLAHRNRDLCLGDELVRFTVGGYDKTTEIVRYDKIQFCGTEEGPLQRCFGLATCRMNLVSAMGVKECRTGMFGKELLERIPAETMARIQDGRYDYRRYF
ncbi:MAG: PH domain-containing protein [archaeon]|nr:PH domain-containing protein [archaeon]